MRKKLIRDYFWDTYWRTFQKRSSISVEVLPSLACMLNCLDDRRGTVPSSGSHRAVRGRPWSFQPVVAVVLLFLSVIVPVFVNAQDCVSENGYFATFKMGGIDKARLQPKSGGGWWLLYCNKYSLPASAKIDVNGTEVTDYTAWTYQWYRVAWNGTTYDPPVVVDATGATGTSQIYTIVASYVGGTGLNANDKDQFYFVATNKANGCSVTSVRATVNAANTSVTPQGRVDQDVAICAGTVDQANPIRIQAVFGTPDGGGTVYDYQWAMMSGGVTDIAQMRVMGGANPSNIPSAGLTGSIFSATGAYLPTMPSVKYQIVNNGVNRSQLLIWGTIPTNYDLKFVSRALNPCNFNQTFSGDPNGIGRSGIFHVTSVTSPQVKTDPPTEVTVCERTGTNLIKGEAQVTTTDGTSVVTFPILYQWQCDYGSGNDRDFRNITDQTYPDGTIVGNSATPNISLNSIDTSWNNFRFRLALTACTGTVYTQASTLRVTPLTVMSIGGAPQDLALCEGSTVAFSVTLAGDVTSALTYKWAESANYNPADNGATATWTDLTVVSATTPNLNLGAATAVRDGRYYRVTVTPAAGSCNLSDGNPNNDKIVTDAAKLTVRRKPVVTIDTKDITRCEGSPSNFTVGATGYNPVFTWQKYSGGKWNTVRAAVPVTSDPGTDQKTNDYVFNVSSYDNNSTYRAQIDACGATVYSTQFKLSVQAGLVLQPLGDVTACKGTTATFTATATNADAGTYLWEQSVNNGLSWNALPASKDAQIVVSALQNSLVRVTANNAACDQQFTQQANFTVLDMANITVTTPAPADGNIVKICQGGSTLLQTTVTGPEPVTRQWVVDRGDGKGFVNLAGENTASLVLNNVAAGNSYNYQLLVTSRCNTVPIQSPTISVNVLRNATITSDLQSLYVCNESNAQFVVTGDAVGYSWQQSINGGPFTAIANETTQQLLLRNLSYDAATPGNNKRQIRVTAQGECTTSIAQSTASLEIVPTTTIANVKVVTTSQAGGITGSDVKVCEGERALFQADVTVGGTPTIVQWQRSDDNGGTWANAPGSTPGSATYTVGSVPVSTGNNPQYRITVSNNNICPAQTSSTLTLTVNPAVTIQTFSDVVVCQGSNAGQFNVVATGQPMSYAWEQVVGGVTTPIANNAARLNISAATAVIANDGSIYRVTLLDQCGVEHTDEAKLFVNRTTDVTGITGPAAGVCEGANAQFAVTAVGAGLSYQWQRSTSASRDFTAIAGATGQSRTFAVQMSDDNYFYRVQVTGTCGPSGLATGYVDTSDPIQLNVLQKAAFTMQNPLPTALKGCAGATLNIDGGISAAVTQHWERNDGTKWIEIAPEGPGQTTLALGNLNSAWDGNLIRVTITGECGAPVLSNTPTLTVNDPAPQAMTIQNASLCANNAQNVDAFKTDLGTTSVKGVTFQWLFDNGTGFVNSPDGGATAQTPKLTLSLAINDDRDNTHFKLQATSACGAKTESNVATLRVNTGPVITGAMTSQTVCDGTPAVFTPPTVTINGNQQIDYTWHQVATGNPVLSNGTDGVSIINGVLTVNRPPTGAGFYATGNQFYVEAASCGFKTTSGSASLTLNNPVQVTAPAKTDFTLCSQERATLAVTFAAGSANMVDNMQWQKDDGTGAGWVNMTNENAASINVAADYATQGTRTISYRLVVNGRCAPNPSSDLTTFRVKAAQAPTLTDPEDDDGLLRVCSGTNATFTRVSSTGLIKWYTDGGLDGNVIWLSADPTSTISISSGSQYYLNGMRFIARAISNECPTEFQDSDPIVLNIDQSPTITIRAGDVWPTELCEGSTPTLRVTAAGANTVQWYDEGPTGIVKIAGSDGLSEFQLPAITASQNGHVIRAQAVGTGACTGRNSPTSVSTTLSVSTKVATGEPDDTEITSCENATVTMNITSTGTAAVPQWQFSADGTTYNDLNADEFPTAKTNEVTLPAGTFRVYDNGYFRLRVTTTSACKAVQPQGVVSGAIQLHVDALAAITTATLPDQTICQGQTASFKVQAVNQTTLEWQWKSNGSNTWRTLGTTIGTQLDVNVPASGSDADGAYDMRQYRVRAQGACNANPPAYITSTLHVNIPPSITTQPPANVSVCDGASPAGITVAASGTGNQYQWTRFNPITSKFDNVPGQVNTTLTIPAINFATDNGSQFQLTVQSTACPAPAPLTSRVVTIAVLQRPTIRTGLKELNYCMGDPAGLTLTIEPSVPADITNYRWTVTPPGAGAITIADGPSLVTTTLSAGNITSSYDGAQYSVIMTGTCGTVSDNEFIHVHLQPKITSTSWTLGTKTAACIGNDVNFEVTADNAANYTWYTDNGTGGANFEALSEGEFLNTFLIPGETLLQSMDGWRYKVVVSGYPTCAYTEEATAELDVRDKPTDPFVADPKDTNVCEGKTANFRATPAPVPDALTYQWQQSSGGEVWTDIAASAGGTRQYLDIPSVTVDQENYRFKLLVRGDCWSAESEPATLTVRTLPRLATDVKDVLICSGTDASFTVGATGSDLTYQWQTDQGIGNWQNITDSVRTALYLPAVTRDLNNHRYRVMFTGGCSATPLLSSTATLTVFNAPVVDTQPADVTTCLGTDVSIKVGASGEEILYQWQTDNGTGTWINIDSATSASLDLGVVDLDKNLFKYRVLLSVPGGGCSLMSNESVLSVSYPPIANAGPDRYVKLGESVELMGSAQGGSEFTYLWTPNVEIADVSAQNAEITPKQDRIYTLTVQNESGCKSEDQVHVVVVENLGIPNSFSPNGDGINDRWMVTNLLKYPDISIKIFDRYGREVYSSFGYGEWDGTSRSAEVPVGTYYYVIDVGMGRPVTGYITLLR